ncbi:MAG: hypothetical protein MR766_04550 [Erysipelotrichaceae bacterium]|nr:hypothetical protein [Erysipelotrichaceae bacterium]
MESYKITASSLVVDEYVEVECYGDKITLTKTTPPEAKKHKKSLEEKVRMLDKRQRAKLANLIDKL